MDILAAIKREEKKLEKQLHKLQHQLNGVRVAAKAFGRFDQQGTQSCKEARDVCCCESEDWEGCQEAVGKVSGAEEESGGIDRASWFLLDQETKTDPTRMPYGHSPRRSFPGRKSVRGIRSVFIGIGQSNQPHGIS